MAEQQDSPATPNPSAAGQEPPGVNPLANADPSPADAAPGGGNVNNGGGGGPRSVRFHFNPSAGQINISSSGGGININASGPGSVPGRMNVNGHPRIVYRNGILQTNSRNVVMQTNSPRDNAGGQMRMAAPGWPVLPPLEPQPMPNQTSDVPVDNEEDGEPSAKDMKRFECAICFEYMDSPVGCGSSSCRARFCAPCLDRARRQEINGRPPNSPDPPDSAKCPHCRSPFTAQSIVLDAALQKEIRDCTETVTCPFKGCGKEMRIGMLQSHEAQCPYIRVRCRYADWGCGWTGRKMDLEDHESDQCEFRGGMGRLVERFRQNDARVGHILQQHHMQVGAQSQMLSLHSRQMMMIRGRNACNPLDVLQMVFEASLFPGRFSALRETWSGMITQQESRCAVCNIMLMVPSLAMILHVSLRGFQLLSSLQIQTSSDDEVWHLADLLLLSLMVLMLGILFIACFFIDAKGPTDWTVYNIGTIIPGHPVLRDVAAICLAMAHFSVIEFFGLHPGVMLWHFTTILTIFLASFVSHIIERNEPPALGTRMVRTARAWPVAIFGLRYGLLFGMCGCAPGVNAVLALRLLKERGVVCSQVVADDSECFLLQFDIAPLMIVAGLVSTIDYAAGPYAVLWWGFMLNLLFASGVLIYVNFLVFFLDKTGRKLGEKNFHMGTAMFMQAHQASGALVPNTKPTSVGCSVFGVCSFLLICIAIV